MKILVFLLITSLLLSSCGNNKKLNKQVIFKSKQNFAKITKAYGISFADKDPKVFQAKIPGGEQMELFVIGYKHHVPVFYNDVTNCTYLLLNDSLKKVDCFDPAKEKIMFCSDSLSVFYTQNGEQDRNLIITTPIYSDTVKLLENPHPQRFFFNKNENKLYFHYFQEGSVLQVVDLKTGILSEKYLNGNVLEVFDDSTYIYYLPSLDDEHAPFDDFYYHKNGKDELIVKNSFTDRTYYVAGGYLLTNPFLGENNIPTKIINLKNGKSSEIKSDPMDLDQRRDKKWDNYYYFTPPDQKFLGFHTFNNGNLFFIKMPSD